MLTPRKVLTTKNQIWNLRLAFRTLSTILLGLALGGCSPPGTRSLVKGDQLSRDGQHTQAIELLKQAAAAVPELYRARAWNHLGMAYHRAGQLEQAANAYQIAIQKSPGLLDARFNLGSALLDLNQLPASITELTAYSDRNPNNATAWLLRGKAYLRAGQFELAEKALSNSLQLDPTSVEALNDLAIAQLKRNKLREAASNLAQAVGTQPTFAPSVLNSAILHHSQRTNRAVALREYQRFLTLQPTSPKADAVDAIARQLDQELAKLTTPTSPAQPTPASPSAAAPSTRGSATAPASTARTTNPPASLPAQAPTPPQVASTSAPVARPAQPATVPVNLPPTQVATPPTAASPSVSTQPAAPSSPPPSSTAPSTAPVAPPPSTTVPVVVRVIEEPAPQPAREIRPEPAPKPPPPSAPVAAPVEANPPSAPSVVQSAEPSAPKPEIAATTSKPPTTNAPSLAQRLNPLSWLGLAGNSLRRSTPLPQGEPPVVATRGSISSNAAAASRSESNRLPVKIAVPTPPVRQWPRYSYVSPKPPAAGDRVRSYPNFSDGLKAHEQRRWIDAAAAYQRAVEFDPSFFEAQYNLGLVEMELGESKRALAGFETALALRPNAADVRYSFALSLRRAGYPPDAANELEKVLAIQPSEIKAHFTLAKLYAEDLSRIDLARQHYQRVLELEPRHPQGLEIRQWISQHLE